MSVDPDIIIRKFRQQGIPYPDVEARKLQDYLNEHENDPPGFENIVLTSDKIAEVAEKRLKGVPLEYIFQRTSFMGHSLHCNGSTLIPTPDTSMIVEAAIDIIRDRQKKKPAQNIIEIGTGCGNIAISLCLETENTRIYTSDISEGAVDVARKNVAVYQLQNRIELASGDMFSPYSGSELRGEVDLVISNPPYIPSSSVQRLSRSIIENEPIVALDAGPFGIGIILRLIEGSPDFLKSGSVLIFEIGEGQEKLVRRLFRKDSRYRDIEELMFGTKVRGIKAIM